MASTSSRLVLGSFLLVSLAIGVPAKKKPRKPNAKTVTAPKTTASTPKTEPARKPAEENGEDEDQPTPATPPGKSPDPKAAAPSKPNAENKETPSETLEVPDPRKMTPATIKERNDRLFKGLEETRKQVIIPEPTLTEDQKVLMTRVEDAMRDAHERALPWVVPASTMLTPTGYGAQWTDVFTGVSIENRSRFGTKPNGTALVGFGLGNAQKLVGLEVAISQYGLSDFPFLRGGVTLKLHHLFAHQIGVAIGYENAIVWGDPDSGQSLFGVVTKYFLLRPDERQWFSMLTVHVGIGDGRFRTEDAVIAGKQTLTPFFSLGLRVLQPVSVIANWSGSDLTMGLSITPFRRFPIGLGIAAMDVMHQAGNGTRFAFNISYGDSVLSKTFPIGLFR
jgi:hypothetical protein